MIIERSMSDNWLSNSYLIGDEEGGHGILVDAGGPVEPVFQAVDRHHLTVTHLLLTHHHGDHVAHLDECVERYGCDTWGHPEERAAGAAIDHEMEDGDSITAGDLRVRALHTPGHTRGMLAFVVNDELVLTGDTLFKGSVGGTMAPGSGSFADLRRSIMEVLMELPREMRVLPGHTEATTIGDEWEDNAFIRIWRGVDPEGEGRCRAMGRTGRLVLRADDYDDGTKCWVRFDEGGDEIVPGSRTEEI